MKVLIGTKNSTKVATAQKVIGSSYDEVVEIQGVDTESGVPDAPWNEETLTGAKNRAESCYALGGADYYIGLESGLVDRYGIQFEEAWAVVITKSGDKLVGYSSGLVIPGYITEKMKTLNLTHDQTMKLIDQELSTGDINKDTWSRYSGGQIQRTISMEEALRNAIIQAVDVEKSLYKYSKTN